MEVERYLIQIGKHWVRCEEIPAVYGQGCIVADIK